MTEIQEQLANRWPQIVLSDDRKQECRNVIAALVRERQYAVDGMSEEELNRRLYEEMAEYSLLTPYLDHPDVDEINVNAWDDIVISYADGHAEKLPEGFPSPAYAESILKRLLHHSGMTIDSAKPIAQGHLPGNTRITAIKSPIVDETSGISASIRRLHLQHTDREALLHSGMATPDMLDFLSLCIRYGVSVVVAGRTNSGKTTLLNALLASVPDDKRIYTIESGTREFALVKRGEEGTVRNNVVHTLSRPSDRPEFVVSQEDLVVAALRFNPDVVAVGEIRDAEASAAVEASLTGHTVVTTVHAGPGEATHRRISLLCQRRFPLGMDVSMKQTQSAFPIVVFTHKCEDNRRRIMDISECVTEENGQVSYRSLWRYNIAENHADENGLHVRGAFEQTACPSRSLASWMTRSGMPVADYERFWRRA